MLAAIRSRYVFLKLRFCELANIEKIATNEKNIKLSRKPSELHRKILGIKKAEMSQNLIESLRIFPEGAILINKNSDSIEYALDKILTTYKSENPIISKSFAGR